MDTFTKFYLYGVAVAALITIFLLFNKKRIFVADLLESTVNILGSWTLVLSLIVKLIKTFLRFRGKDYELINRDKDGDKKQKIHKIHYKAKK